MASDTVVCYYDLETSRFGDEAEILQIGAVCGDDSFNQFITPVHSISPAATAKHGLTRFHQQLYKHGEFVPSVPIGVGLNNFLSFLQNLDGPRVLAAHGKAFYHHYLERDICNEDLWSSFSSEVCGLVDTLEVCRDVLNRNSGCGLQGLVAEFLNQDVEHDALDDAFQLRELMSCLDISDDDVLEYTKYF